MTAVDPEGRIRHPLDVFHSTFDPVGANVPAGYVPVADGLGQVDYVDSATFTGATTLDALTDVTITSATTGDRLRFDGSVWRNSALIWRPVTVYDPTSGLWVPLVDGNGNAIMAEA